MLAFIRDLFRRTRTPAGITVAEAMPHYQASRAARGLRAITLQNYGVFGRSLVAEWGDRPLASIRPEDYRNLQRSQNYREHVKVFLRWAYLIGHLRTDVTVGISTREKIRCDAPPISYLSPSEAQRFFHCIGEEYKAAFALAMYAGLRPYEVCRIDWSAISVRERRIRVDPDVSKIRRMRLIEGVPNILWAQLSLREESRGPILRRSTRNGQAEPSFGVWSTERLRAARVSNVTLTHDVLRHSFATYFVALTGSPDKAAKVLGHYDLRMLATHYDGVATKQDAEDYFHPKPVLALKDRPVEKTVPI